MRAVIQRVSKASVEVEKHKVATIEVGFLILLGIEIDDMYEDIQWLASKIVNLRVFNDEAGLMNRGLRDIEGEILLVSQFTLHASTKKGNRPSFLKAARPEVAIPIYTQMITQLESELGKKIQVGQFGADMKVSLTNDGPVTIVIDTKHRE